MYWKILNSTHPLKDEYISIRADQVELPNGRVVEPFYVYENSDFVHAIAITDDEEVVMVRQYRHGAGIIVLETPGGHIEIENKSDTPLKAAQRELLEETGYGGGDWIQLPTFYTNPAKMNNKMYVFLATGVKKISEQNLDDMEEIEVVLIPLKTLKEMVFSGEINTPFHVTALSFALKSLGLLQVG